MYIVINFCCEDVYIILNWGCNEIVWVYFVWKKVTFLE